VRNTSGVSGGLATIGQERSMNSMGLTICPESASKG